MRLKQVGGYPLQRIHARASGSISDLKKNPSGIIAEAHGEPAAILNHNRPTAYLVPAAAVEALLERLDDRDLAHQVRERQGKPTVRMTLDEL